jgi:hypothetical protein
VIAFEVIAAAVSDVPNANNEYVFVDEVAVAESAFGTVNVPIASPEVPSVGAVPPV